MSDLHEICFVAFIERSSFNRTQVILEVELLFKDIYLNALNEITTIYLYEENQRYAINI